MVLCSIAPPDLLARLADEGTQEQRAAALSALATSASLRTRRALLASLIQQGIDIQGMPAVAKTTRNVCTVYDLEHQGMSSLPGRLVHKDGDPPSKDPSVNEAREGALKTRELYETTYGRDSIDGHGMELISSVHYGVNYDNAFWLGNQMCYGDGSGQLFIAGGLTKAIDVIGHELTHGVTQFTANLEYHKQSGALNESFSDVFGSLVKQYAHGQSAEQADWLIGEGILVPQLGVALRSMKAPGTAHKGDRQPAHMDHYLDLPDDNDPRNDNGGVHINSGIPNHAFYLAATAIGGKAWESAGRIWYWALTERLRATSQFVDAANATIEGAGQLFPNEPHQEKVEKAWRDVGVLS
jgi:Zn-dependent metalloprotease